jgi:hypothetical protein
MMCPVSMMVRIPVMRAAEHNNVQRQREQHGVTHPAIGIAHTIDGRHH